MENKILIFGHKNPDTDTICSALVKEILNKKNGCEKSKSVRLGNVNKETQYALKYLGLEAPELIEKVEEGQEVILVDHNEFNQSVEGIEKAKILEVVDHHRISNFETSEPLYYTARPFGCTSTILFEEFKQNNIEIEKTEAVLMASAIISDTLLLKSPTTTEHDKKALEELGKIANINIEEYGLEMLKAGTDLDDFSEEELINLDAKSLDKNGIKFVIAGRRKRIVPVISCNTAIQVSYEGVIYNLSPGKNKVFGICIKEGENILTFSGKATISVDYRGGLL